MPEDFPSGNMDASAQWSDQQMMAVQMPDGRIVMQDMHSAPSTRRPSTSSAQVQFDNDEEAETVPMDDGQDMFAPTYSSQQSDNFSLGAGPSSGPRHMVQYGGQMVQTSPMPMPPPMHMGYTSPTDSMHMHSGPGAQYATPMPMSASLHGQHPAYRRDGPPPPRPNLQHRHTTAVGGSRPPPLQRHFSADPSHPGHPQVHDVFAAPTGTTPRRQGHFDKMTAYHFEQDVSAKFGEPS